MVIIFYDPKINKLYIATKDCPMRIVEPGSDIINIIPEEDVMYVKSGDMMTRSQFDKFMKGELVWEEEMSDATDVSSSRGRKTAAYGNNADSPPTSTGKRRFIHSTREGTLIIGDIKHPNAENNQIILRSKYQFIDVEEYGGEETFESSVFFRLQRDQGKVEYVDEEYVAKNKSKIDKYNQKFSERELNRILVPEDYSAHSVAEAGGLGEVNDGYEDEDAAIRVEIG